ncbi:stage 0 sporulation protein [Candidatus Dependentiae bacterium]|nr:stage 0 sporulation protein [Candidatus Dependentiae bacterium]
MKTVLGIKYKLLGQIEYFGINESQDFSIGTTVKVQSEDGVWMGKVETIPKEIDEDNHKNKIFPVLGQLNLEDLKTFRDNRLKAKKVFDTCFDIINNLELAMKLIDVEYNYDRTKGIFYYTADGRIDFRELVKELAFKFKTRIEMKQIGVRDEAKIRGGHGLCGIHLCCNRFLQNFETVTIKNAKDQNLNINTAKISGVCGRLMCCLTYELDFYKDFLKKIPQPGTSIQYLGKRAKVTGFNAIKNCITIIYKDGIFKDIDISLFAGKDLSKIEITEKEVSDFELKKQEKIFFEK